MSAGDVKLKFGAEDVGLEKTLKSVQTELGQLQTKVKSGDLSMSELESTMKRIGQVESLEKRLKGMGGEAAQTSPKINELGDQARTMGKKAEDAGERGHLSLGKIGAAAGVAGAAFAAGMKVMELAAAATRAVIDSFGEALDLGGRLTDLKARTGETAGQLLLLERAFDNTGVGAEKVGTVINKLQNFMQDAANGGDKQTAAMAQLGITLQELQGKTPIEQMRIFAERIAAIEDPTQRVAVASDVFGTKLGGSLLPILTSFSGELRNAQDELGSMTKIMDQNSDVFDTIGDKFEIIKGKLMEFAAGVMSRALPALELFTTAFSKFDAAGFGQRLADAFIGGREAMNGFSKALEALKVGNLSLAFEIAFASVLLQTKQTANEIYKNFVASLKAVGGVIVEVLGPDSTIWSMISMQFEKLGLGVELSFKRSVKSIMEATGLFSTDTIKAIQESIDVTSDSISSLEYLMKASAGTIKTDFKNAASAFPEEFKRAYGEINPIFDVQQDIQKVSDLTSKLAEQPIFGEEAVKTTQELRTSLKEMQDESLSPLQQVFAAVGGTAKNFSDAMLNLGNNIRSVPNEKNIGIKMNGTDQAEAEIKRVSNALDGMPNQKTVELALDAGSFNNLAELKKELELFPDSKQIKLVLEKTGLSLEELKEQINGIPEEKRAKIAIEATGIDDLGKARDILNAIEDKSIEAAAKAIGVEDITELESRLNGVPDQKTAELAMKITGKDSIEEAAKALESFPGTKDARLLIETSGLSSVTEVRKMLDGIPNEKQTKLAVEASGLQSVEDLKKAIDLIQDGTAKIDANTSSADAKVKELDNSIKKLGSEAVEVNLNASGSVEKIRSQLSKEIDLGLSSSKGTDILNQIKPVIEAIRDLVTKLEQKLPQSALGY
jgi:hypothetical protein